MVAQPDRNSPLDALIGSENAFARQAREEGTRRACLAALDRNSVLFSGNQPVNGYQLWRDRPENDEGLLAWFPAVAAVAASGELGYTIGPSYFKPHKDPGPVYFGYYFSVWHRDPAASGCWWTPAFPAPNRPEPIGWGRCNCWTAPPWQSIWLGRRAGRKLPCGTRKNGFTGWPKPKWKRPAGPASPPAPGCCAKTQRSGKAAPPCNCSPNQRCKLATSRRGAGVARDGDLAYTYGEVRATYRQAGGATEQPGFYVRTWRYTGTGWQLTAELLNHQ